MKQFKTFKEYQEYIRSNISVFDRAFKPWRKWEDTCLSELCPCKDCDISKEIRNNNHYYQMSGGAEEELTKPCKSCLAAIQWETECLGKLKWYETHDDKLKGKENNEN